MQHFNRKPFPQKKCGTNPQLLWNRFFLTRNLDVLEGSPQGPPIFLKVNLQSKAFFSNQNQPGTWNIYKNKLIGWWFQTFTWEMVGCFTKHLFKDGCLGYQEGVIFYSRFFLPAPRRASSPPSSLYLSILWRLKCRSRRKIPQQAKQKDKTILGRKQELLIYMLKDV